MFDKEIVLQAYYCLKSYAYYENFNFFLKADVACFENTRFSLKINRIVRVLNNLENGKDSINEWLGNISAELLPKKIDSHLNLEQINNALFLSNKKTSDSYKVKEVNYLISAPVEIYIIDCLWSIFVGSLLDNSFSKSTYGNRIHPSINEIREEFPEKVNPNSKNIFQMYIENYNKWRDQGINKAIDIISTDDKDVAIFSLDLKGYYYNIETDFSRIETIIKNNQESELINISLTLNELLKKIHLAYKEYISPTIIKTHPKVSKAGIPIGLTSSAVLANWYLNEFDEDVEALINPAYYGRYVDDMLFVFKSPKISTHNNNEAINEFIGSTLKGFLIQDSNDNDSFLLAEKYHSLPIQKDKLILHYFDKNHSLAGLQIFKQELENRSSAFRFLPDEHISNDLDRFAYDILYDGSANKFRSIVGLAENETELSKYLSTHTLAHRLCKLPPDEGILKQIELFFKGENALRFSRLWEKVLAYALVTTQYKFMLTFYNSIKDCIDKIEWEGDNIDDSNIELKLTEGLGKYLDISFCLTASLLNTNISDGFNKNKDSNLNIISNIISGSFKLQKLTNQFRKSNLLRHHLVSWPLANYTDYDGDLTHENTLKSLANNSLDNLKIKRSPRYIHADEYQLFDLIHALRDKSLYTFTKNNSHHNNNCSVKEFKNKPALKIKLNNENPLKKVKIALANMQINENSIESACRKDRSPDISYKRQKDLYKILNAATEENAHILLLPELSIPVSWLPFMSTHARHKQIALVFGLEHWVVNGIAYNLIVEILPYKSNETYNSSFIALRVKNHYAPNELEILDSFRLNHAAPKKRDKKYHLVKWRGISFATYNCFELADIKHRSLFRSQIDILFACVWNKDVSYYEHITESAARDIHCYIAQANTSQYGGSCVLQPTSNLISNKIYVKGGENTCILTTTLNIDDLREAQFREKRVNGDTIKYNPPGFSHKKLLKRN